MDIKTLKERISKKENQIEKINKRIAKWSAGLTDEQRTYAGLTWLELRKVFKEKKYTYETERKIEELHGAITDLKENVETLNKYYNSLQLEEAKANEVKIPVIVEFLNKWKKACAEYIANDMKDYIKFREINAKRIDLMNKRWALSEEDLQKANATIKALKTEEEILLANINALTREVYSRNEADHINHEYLAELLEKEANKRYYNLVEKVTKITGKIKDASYLTIGLDGNLNGIIVGEDGKAKVNTIGAGGYNIQCYHYRVLVHKI